MAISVVMPALEMAQETGKLVAWLKKEGEHVAKGEMLLEIETDKAVMEIEAQGEGILAGITAQLGDVIPVGQTIAWLVQPGEVPPTTTAPSQSGRKMDAPAAQASAAPTAAAAAPTDRASARISPRARRLAKEHDIDLSTVNGSGQGGEILAEDILKLVEAKGAGTSSAPTAVAGSSVQSLSTIGRIMADRTTQSWTTVPHFFVAREVDGTALNAARAQLIPLVEASHSVRVTHTDLLVALVARALAKHPRMNSSWTGIGISVNPSVNVALAMAVDEAVVTTVLPDADRASIGDLAVRRKELATRARANRLQPADINGATFTISNLGMFNVDAFTAIIVPPQAGILAVGAMVDRAVVVNGEVVVRPMMTLTLSSDHRVIDGAGAATFMNTLVELIHSAAAALA